MTDTPAQLDEALAAVRAAAAKSPRRQVETCHAGTVAGADVRAVERTLRAAPDIWWTDEPPPSLEEFGLACRVGSTTHRFRVGRTG